MDTAHTRYKTSNPYEETFGYCRALRKGPFIFVSATTAIDTVTGKICHPDSAFDQAIKAFKEVVTAIEALGGKKEDIVRIRMFVASQNDATEVGRALKQEMGEVQPTATMILGAKFVSSEMLVEIEVDAVSFGYVAFCVFNHTGPVDFDPDSNFEYLLLPCYIYSEYHPKGFP